jgi:hypothetical protein
MIEWLARLKRRGQAEDISLEVAQDRKRLGDQARRLLDDPVLKLAFELVEDDVAERWRATGPNDAQLRETLHHMHVGVQQARSRLERFLGDAKLLEFEQKRREAA